MENTELNEDACYCDCCNKRVECASMKCNEENPRCEDCSKCCLCGTDISFNVADYSMKTYGVTLCREKCQKIFNKALGIACCICETPFETVQKYNDSNFVCSKCKTHIDEILNEEKRNHHFTTRNQVLLHLALKYHEQRSELNKKVDYEYIDYKGDKQKSTITVDIALPDAKILIEVNGIHHASQAKQVNSDIFRLYNSFKDGWMTLPIYNIVMLQDGINGFKKVIKTICKIAEEKKKI